MESPDFARNLYLTYRLGARTRRRLARWDAEVLAAPAPAVHALAPAAGRLPSGGIEQRFDPDRGQSTLALGRGRVAGRLAARGFGEGPS